MNEIQLESAWTRVQAFRTLMDQHSTWKTPDTHDILRFAAQEASEAQSAHMKNTRPHYARRKQEGNVYMELGMCAVMLLSFPENPLPNSVDKTFTSTNELIDDLQYYTASAVRDGWLGLNWAKRWVGLSLSVCSLYPGFDLNRHTHEVMLDLIHRFGETVAVVQGEIKIVSPIDRVGD